MTHRTKHERVSVQFCPQADRAHQRSPRSYAHVGHYSGIICIAHATIKLPPQYSLAILLHELGHLELLPREHTEQQADGAGSRLARVRIRRRTYGQAKNLEYISRRDLPRARTALHRLTDLR